MDLPIRSTRDVIIRTPALDQASAFYAQLLGVPARHYGDALIGFETGSFYLYLENGPQSGPVFEVLVPDVQVCKQRLVAAGCTVLEEDAAVPRCYIRDPYGLVFNIGQA